MKNKIKTIKTKLARKAAIETIKFLLEENNGINLDTIIKNRIGGEKIQEGLNMIQWMIKENNWNLPLKWLLHYLEGSGTDLLIPNEVIDEAEEAILSAFTKDLKFETGYKSPFNRDSKYFVNHSLMYGSAGFEEKPILFYLVGGFTYSLKGMKLYAEDVYDWHPNKGENKEYFSSPLGEEFAPLFRILDSMFPYGWFDGENGSVSNKFFADMEEAGAKPFKSIINYEDGYLLDEIYYFIENEFPEHRLENAKKLSFDEQLNVFENSFGEVVAEYINEEYLDSTGKIVGELCEGEIREEEEFFLDEGVRWFYDKMEDFYIGTEIIKRKNFWDDTPVVILKKIKDNIWITNKNKKMSNEEVDIFLQKNESEDVFYIR